MTKSLALKPAIRCLLAVILAAVLALMLSQPSLAQDGPGEGETPPVEQVPGEPVSGGEGLVGDEEVSTFYQGPPEEFLAAEIEPSLMKTSMVVSYVPAGGYSTLKDSLVVADKPCKTFPQEAKAAVSYAANIWASLLSPHYAVPIDVEVCLVDLAIPDQPTMISLVDIPLFRGFDYSPFGSEILYPSALKNGLDGFNPSQPDIAILLNSQMLPSLYYGTGPVTPADKYNLASVILHDIGHGLGLRGSFYAHQTGGEKFGRWGYPLFDEYGNMDMHVLAFDMDVVDSQGQRLITTYLNNSSMLGEALTSGAVYFNGAKAKAANGGKAVKLDAPDPFNLWLGLNHLDEMYNNTPNALMTKSLAKGETIYDPGPVAKGILADLHWTMASTTPAAPLNLYLKPSQVKENQAVGTVVGILTAVDPNPDDTFMYSLVAGTGSTDNASFEISGNTLKTKAVLNHEAKHHLSTRVRVTDQTGRSYERAVEIFIEDVNEAPTSIRLNYNSLPEGSSRSPVGSFQAIDPDNGGAYIDNINFSLVPGTGSTDNALFDITSTDYLYGGPFNYEVKNRLSIRVRATDPGGLFMEQVFTILVTNVNESPYGIQLSSAQINENMPKGTVIGTLTTIDRDNGDTHSFSVCGGVHSYLAAISGDRLVTNAAYNHEQIQVLNICIRTTDQGGLSYQKPFSITVNNVNETATYLDLGPKWILPGSKAGSRVGDLFSDDPDIGDTLTYTLTPGFGDNVSFTIDGNQLKLVSDLSKVEGETFTIQVELKDAAGTGPAPQEITITVLVPKVTYLPALTK